MSETREELMRQLLFHKDGLTIEELSERLKISRSGVQQQLSHLLRDRLVKEVSTRSTKGRPSRVYALTDAGYETFPRHYAMLSALTLRSVRDALGPDALKKVFEQVGNELIASRAHRVRGDERERLEAVVDMMNELGYSASPAEDGAGISAVNCIYHHLAREIREVCHLDITLLEGLLGQPITHARCMVDGDHECLFHIGRTSKVPTANNPNE